MALPMQPVTAPPANPLPGGLYQAATITDETQSRHQGGITLVTPNNGGHGRWPVDLPTPAGTPNKAGERPAPRGFPATIVWAADEPKAVGVPESEVQDRALQALRLGEPLEVEEFVAEQLSEITPTATVGIKHAVELLEDALAARGYLGVIHARRGLIAHLNGLIVRQGGQLLTPGGHRWAFGAGYHDLGDTLVGTGPVMIRRGPVVAASAFEPKTNKRLALGERVVSVGWESPTAAVTLARAGAGDTLPGSDTLPGTSTLPTS